ncbi:MAG TPA: class I SAM-dependent methyltransferase [Allosphingosinicella sp.]|jgi:SAM-dependent methyltransferase|nr:class I SAM-dependent methyltransferase [Allosphingosinicella sp.]
MKNEIHDDVERLKIIYEGKGEGRAPFWSRDVWGPLIPEIQFGEGQFRDLVIDELRSHGFQTSDMARLSAIELGCGWGRNLHLFLELGIPARNIAGVDLIEDFIAFGQSQNPSLNIAAGDATRTSFPDGAFDIVLLHTVLSAILDRDIQSKLLVEARRLVKPGGLVFVFDVADHYPIGRTEVSGEQLAFIEPIPRLTLCAIAADAGLTMAGWRRSGLMPRPRKLVFRGVFSTIAARLGRSLSSPRNFAFRLALARLLSLLPRANSHYFITFVPDPA